MVKIQKNKAYTYEAKDGSEIEHFKFSVVIPEETMQKLGWESGLELSLVPKGNSLILKPEMESES